MSLLFIFFALPIATILLAIVLQKLLKCPILVAITFFAIYLIVSFAAFSDILAEALIATIIYTIIAFITAVIVRTVENLIDRIENTNNNSDLQNGGVVFENNTLSCQNNSRRTGTIRRCCRRN